MTEDKEKELEKRVEDIRAIRQLLAEGDEIPLVHPWAFMVWAFLVGAGSVVHYLLFLRSGIEVRTALVWIWLPVLILGALAESISWAVRLNKRALPLFNRRLGGAILACLASMIVLTVAIIHLALVAFTPGMAILLSTVPLVFYAQVCYASLFIETFAGIAGGLLLEFAGVEGPVSLLAAGLAVAFLYAVSGVHAQLIERRRRD